MLRNKIEDYNTDDFSDRMTNDHDYNHHKNQVDKLNEIQKLKDDKKDFENKMKNLRETEEIVINKNEEEITKIRNDINELSKNRSDTSLKLEKAINEKEKNLNNDYCLDY